MTFIEAWAIADRIPGWFVQGEGALLYRLASSVPEDQCLVEVGCYRGRSAALLAATGRQTYLIDPLKLGETIDGRPINAADIGDLTRFVAARENVIFWNTTTDSCPDPVEQIGLLHIDGCHEGPWPLTDFNRFKYLLTPGAYVLFHDVDDAPAVRKTVDALCTTKVLRPFGRAAALAAFVVEDRDA